MRRAPRGCNPADRDSTRLCPDLFRQSGLVRPLRRRGLIGFLDASLNKHVQRILLIDGPAVLGWRRWRELESRYGLGAIHAMLERAVDEGDLTASQPLEALAHLLLAAADEGALLIANSSDPHQARDQAVQALTALLAGLHADGMTGSAD